MFMPAPGGLFSSTFKSCTALGFGDGSDAQSTVFAEDQGSVPTWWITTICNSNFLVSYILFSFAEYYIQYAQTYMKANHSYTLKS